MNGESEKSSKKDSLSAHSKPAKSGELADAFNDFENRYVMQPMQYNDCKSRSILEERLDSIIKGAMLMADASHTRDETRDRIYSECSKVKEALQTLLSAYMKNSGKKEAGTNLTCALESMGKKTKTLQRQLRRAVVDHISDSFLDVTSPIEELAEAATNTSSTPIKSLATAASAFAQHADKLIEVASLACSVSDNEEGIKLVKTALDEVRNLYPQVVNAAKVCSAYPQSAIANQNFLAFKRAWTNQIKILVECVDDITTINDFLLACESHILEDINKCLNLFNTKRCSSPEIHKSSQSIQQRSLRVCHVVALEMENYEPGPYTQRVLKAVSLLKNQIVPHFCSQIDSSVKFVASDSKDAFTQENDLIEACRLIYDGVREIRRSILFNKALLEEELERGEDEFSALNASSVTNNEAPEETTSADALSEDLDGKCAQNYDDYADPNVLKSDRAKMRQLPQEAKEVIQKEIQYFNIERARLDKEVSKWDENGNDIVVLSKHMCMIMLEMADFTRGRGPLKSTKDVINASQKISEAGKKLHQLAERIAEKCPESSSKKDLLVYIGRIDLYCQQINITSRVKADVTYISGEVVVSGLDSVTSLIQAAKNLMSTVVLVVKSSYVASTKYRSRINNPNISFSQPAEQCPSSSAANTYVSTSVGKSSICESIANIVWKLKPPEKKPLFEDITVAELNQAVVRRVPSVKKTRSLL